MNTGPGEDLLDLVDAVLEGRLSYSSAAEKLGLARSTVERRIKRFVSGLFQAGLLDMFRAEWVDDLPTLRRERDVIMRAARSLKGPLPKPRTEISGRQEVAEVVRRLRARGGNGFRDGALLSTVFATGIKPIELARLVVSDYLAEDGSVRSMSTLRAEAAANGVARPLRFECPLMVECLDAYMESRLERSHGTGEAGRYRGMDPQSMLFVNESGRAFQITARSPTDPRPACKYLQATLRQAFARAGWQGMTSSKLRRKVARDLSINGTREAQELLGLKSKRSVRRLLERADGRQARTAEAA